VSVRGWIWGAGLGFAVIAAAASLPMRVGLDGAGAAEAGLSARAVRGTVWDGVLEDGQIGAVPLGTVELGLAPLALLRGQFEMHFARQGAEPLYGRLMGRGIADVNGSLALGAQFGPVSVARLDLSAVNLHFDAAGRCLEAGGRVTAALAGPVGGLNLAQGLSGPLSCSDERVAAQLTSQSGMETLRFSAGADGAWQARFKVVTSSDPALVSGLAEMGFRSVADGYVLTSSGRL
jgi:general secretion pathway protein N